VPGSGWLTRRLFGTKWRVVAVTPNFFGTRWRIERNRDTAQLAHQAYVELITRKAGIMFEEENDVIVEICDSWYVLFGEIRSLSRKIDSEAIAKNSDLRSLHELLISVLNKGLRPHLTQWQARFRHWYAEEVKNSPGVSPQDLQRQYPQYADLISSLRESNRLLIELNAELRVLSQGH